MSNNDKPPGGNSASWFKRLGKSLCKGPDNLEELRDQLKQARSRALIDMDALDMIEGVLSVSDLRVRDIMIPRAEMAVLGRDDDLDKILPLVIETAHSRFPVINDDKAEIVGILLAKDLLQYCGNPDNSFNVRDILRSAVFVPESKRLNVLLKEFRTRRNHMAIVVDEYGAAAGLVTIEDVLEQIVGEIEDEHDFAEDAQILKHSENEYTAKAQLEIEDFNSHFNTSLPSQEFDTIGGLVTHAIGHLPKRGERVVIDQFEFRVIRADSRKIRLLSVNRLQ
jgi:magnesium and cobalt transporter